MKKLTSVADLKELKQQSSLASNPKDAPSSQQPIVIKVAMATCGIASGAKATYNYFVQELERQKIKATVCQTGCMSYCYAEPTVEITLAGEEPVVFGFVNSAKAQEIIDKYIIQHQLIDGIIPASYKTV